MELSRILNILYRYIWLFVLAILVSGFTTFFVLNQQKTSYKATAQLLVGPGLDSPSPDLNSLKIGGQLIQTYAELAGTRSFFEAVNNKLEQKIDIDVLDSMVSTRQNTETRILTIIVYNPDPKQAVAIANSAAQTLIEMSPSKDNTTTLLRSQMSEQSRQLEQIVSNAETNVQQLEAELAELKNFEAQNPDETKMNLEKQNLIIKQLSDERNRLSDTLRTLVTIYQALLDTNTNQLEIIEPARVANPVAQNIKLRLATSGLTGLAFAILIIFMVEYFDDRFRFPQDFSKEAGVPLLTAVDKHGGLIGSGPERFIAFADPKSRAANNYREAIAKLLFSAGEATPQTFMVSSVESISGHDAATITGNLAVTFSKAGSRVVLIDAQLHNPILTRVFKAENKEGLVDAVVANSAKLHLMNIEDVPGLHFLPVGLSPERSSSTMLNSAKVAKLIEAIKKEVDIILIAGSTISRFAESLTVASQASAVILTTCEGESRLKTLNKLVSNLREMKIPLIGVLFDHNHSWLALDEKLENVSFVKRFVSRVDAWINFRMARKNDISEQITNS